MCSASGNDCAANINTDFKECLKPCEGIYADFLKYYPKKIEGDYYADQLNSYYKYKRFFESSNSRKNQHISIKLTI